MQVVVCGPRGRPVNERHGHPSTVDTILAAGRSCCVFSLLNIGLQETSDHNSGRHVSTAVKVILWPSADNGNKSKCLVHKRQPILIYVPKNWHCVLSHSFGSIHETHTVRHD